MNESKGPGAKSYENRLATIVGKSAARKLTAKRNEAHGAWYGLGMIGLIGWTICVPTLIGAALGSYLERAFPAKFSWTLALLAAGLAIGCFNAWAWVAAQARSISEPEVGNDD